MVVAVIFLVLAIITQLVFSLGDEGDEESEKSQTEDEDGNQEDEVPAQTVAIDFAGSTDPENREEDHNQAQC